MGHDVHVDRSLRAVTAAIKAEFMADLRKGAEALQTRNQIGRRELRSFYGAGQSCGLPHLELEAVPG